MQTWTNLINYSFRTNNGVVDYFTKIYTCMPVTIAKHGLKSCLIGKDSSKTDQQYFFVEQNIRTIFKQFF